MRTASRIDCSRLIIGSHSIITQSVGDFAAEGYRSLAVTIRFGVFVVFVLE